MKADKSVDSLGEYASCHANHVGDLRVIIDVVLHQLLEFTEVALERDPEASDRGHKSDECG